MHARTYTPSIYMRLSAMEDQTQAVLGDEEEEGRDHESEINPLGYLRVLSQKDLEQTDYPIQEGEVTLGRGSDCDLVIEARSLSRKHAKVLVEGGTHFIQDLDSRNKTHRGTVQLRPNAFYEITHGCELTFADIKCVYYIGTLPEEEEEEEGEAAANEEATQAYSVGEEEGGGEGGEEDDSDETDDDDVNAEPTQAYHFDGAAAEGEEQEEEEEPMDCDATVAYRIEADEGKESDSEDSPPSSPILVATKQLLPKEEDTSKAESSASSGAKKPSKPKKVCFAAGTSPGSVEEAAASSKASTSKKEEEGGGDETDGEETDGEEESTQPYEKGEGKARETGKDETKEKEKENKGDTTTKETETGAGSAMEVDDGDPTVAYELETDEENTNTEEAGGTKDEKKTEGAAGGAEPTVPYNLKEEDEEDSDKTDIEQEESETAPGTSKVAKESEAETVSGSSKKEDATAKVAIKEHSEETEDRGDTEKVESSATEPESQEVKEKPAHLRPPPRVAQNAKTLSAISLMECMEQGGDGGGGTVLLESYESTCDETVPLQPSPAVTAADKEATTTMATVAMETVPLSSSVAAKEEEERGSVEEKEEQPLTAAQHEEVKKEEESDSSDSLIPELPSLGSKGISGSKRSRQKTLFEAVSSQRGRRRGGRRGQRRKATITRKAGTRIEEPSSEGKAEDRKEVESKSSVKTEATLCLKTEEDTDKKNKATTDSDGTKTELKTLDSIGGISGKVANLRLKTLSLVTPATTSGGEVVADGASATASKNETAAASEEAKVKEEGRKRGRGRGRKRTASRQASGTGIGQSRTVTETTSAATIVADTADLLQEEESPDLPFLSKVEDQSDHTNKSHDHEADTNDLSDHSVSTTSTASLDLSHGGRGRKGKGRGGASKRGRPTATPRRKSSETAPKTRTPSSTPSLRQHRTPSSASRVASKSPSSTPGEKPRIMFTGLIDKNGEKTIRELGGELVDSVYQCTHLITDKVRRTVKFLCCLSRGCLIVSDGWLDQCAMEKRFLPAEPYLIKDKPAERQHKFTLQRSHESAKVIKLLAGYKVYLTPNVKPEREQMSDIIKCSGGEVFDFGPSFSPGEKVIVIACEEDLALCKDAMESGVPVHSTELILGGVLRQELELHDHLMTAPSSSTSVAGRKRRAKESSLIPAAKRKRK